MFDWDRDYTELVEKPKAADAGSKMAEVTPKVIWSPAARLASPHILPVLLVAVFLAGLAYEKADAARSVLSFGMASTPEWSVFGVSALTPNTGASAMIDALPPELVVYERAQYQRFMLGLSNMTLPELQNYAQRTRADLDAAPGALAPFYTDALFLLEREALQRGL